MEAAEKRMQEEKSRGVSKIGQVELELKQKRMEDAERLEREKNGNYSLQVKNKIFFIQIFF